MFKAKRPNPMLKVIMMAKRIPTGSIVSLPGRQDESFIFTKQIAFNAYDGSKPSISRGPLRVRMSEIFLVSRTTGNVVVGHLSMELEWNVDEQTLFEYLAQSHDLPEPSEKSVPAPHSDDEDDEED